MECRGGKKERELRKWGILIVKKEIECVLADLVRSVTSAKGERD